MFLVLLLTATSIPRSHVTVTDPANNFVVGLYQRNFEISEDKVVQKIEKVSTDDVPLSAALVLEGEGNAESSSR
jgi:hypothetical protein